MIFKRMIFNETKTRQDASFRGNPLFQSYEEDKNKQSIYLSWPVGFLQKEVGERLEDK